MDSGFRLFPEQASTIAGDVDRVYFFVLAVAAFLTALIFVLILWFAIKYRRGSSANRLFVVPETKFWMLEVGWSVIPLLITMIMFVWGARLFFHMQAVPENCLEITVVGKQWMWKFQHPDGRQEINTLHVPLGRSVKLTMTSEDVIHSLYIPAFRIKQDVLPGSQRFTTAWFHATRPGTYHLFCAEYCGTSHSRMVGSVVVQAPAEYGDWLSGRGRESPEAAGRLLYERHRCDSCHDVELNPRCPPLEGVYGRQVKLDDGRTVQANDEYLRESILNPGAKVVAGYQPVMPSYQGQLGGEQVLQIIAYLKSRRGADPTKTKRGGDRP